MEPNSLKPCLLGPQVPRMGEMRVMESVFGFPLGETDKKGSSVCHFPEWRASEKSCKGFQRSGQELAG